MSWFVVWAIVMLLGIGASVVARAQGPQPSCDEQLNNEMFQRGGVIQQLAVARAQLTAMTKERDDAKAALVKAAPKPSSEPAKP